jgi:hypothetical protein
LPIGTADFRIEMSKITVMDVILISAVLLLSIGIMVRGKLFRESPTLVRAEAVVYCDGQELQRIDLQKDREIALPGGKMVLAVEGGTIRVKESDCHRQVCVHAGLARFPGETIVCVPNKTVIEIAAGGVPGVDAVAF